MKVWPGHGRRFVTRAGQLIVLLSSKVDSMYHQRKKAAKLMWTQPWRRMHKKVNVESTGKRRVRKVVRVERAPTGLTMEAFTQMKKKAVAAPAAVAGGAKPAVVQQASVADAKAKAKARQAAKKASAPGKAQFQAAKHAGKGR